MQSEMGTYKVQEVRENKVAADQDRIPNRMAMGRVNQLVQDMINLSTRVRNVRI